MRTTTFLVIMAWLLKNFCQADPIMALVMIYFVVSYYRSTPHVEEHFDRFAARRLLFWSIVVAG